MSRGTAKLSKWAPGAGSQGGTGPGTWQVFVAGAQEAQRPHAVVDGHHNDVAPHGDLLPIVQVVVQEIGSLAASEQEGTAVDINHHRQLGRDWEERNRGRVSPH